MRIRLVIAAVLAGLVAGPAWAGDKEVAALKAVFAPGPTDSAMFEDAFLKIVPAAQLDAILLPIKAQIGPVVSVTLKQAQTYTIQSATYEMLAEIALDADGKIAGLLVHPAIPLNGSIDALLAGFSSISPHLAYLVTKDGAVLSAKDAGTALAVGSAFKMGVLKALKDQIDAGTRKWSDVVTLGAGDISLPTGMIQGWPVGSPLTLHTAVALMISISDNTAADLLLRTVGRDKVEAALGIAPALTTRELFTLKGHPDLKARYAAADTAGKRNVLDEADKLPLPEFTTLPPLDAGVEWYLSPEKLCALIGEVGDLDVMHINPGLASPADWAHVAFKGGSEVGVLSLTTQLSSKDGHRYCVSVIWNGSTMLDESKAEGAYAGVLGTLAKR